MARSAAGTVAASNAAACIVRQQLRVECFGARFLVEEERDELEPLGAGRQVGLQPVGVDGGEDAGLQQHGVRVGLRVEAVGQHEVGRERQHQFDIDRGAVADFGQGAILHHGDDFWRVDVVAAVHGDQLVEAAQVEQVGQLRGGQRDDAADRHLDRQRVRMACGQGRAALQQQIFDGRCGAGPGLERTYQLVVAVILDLEAAGVLQGRLVREVVDSRVEFLNATLGEVGVLREQGGNEAEKQKQRSGVARMTFAEIKTRRVAGCSTCCCGHVIPFVHEGSSHHCGRAARTLPIRERDFKSKRMKRLPSFDQWKTRRCAPGHGPRRFRAGICTCWMQCNHPLRGNARDWVGPHPSGPDGPHPPAPFSRSAHVGITFCRDRCRKTFFSEEACSQNPLFGYPASGGKSLREGGRTTFRS